MPLVDRVHDLNPGHSDSKACGRSHSAVTASPIQCFNDTSDFLLCPERVIHTAKLFEN